MASQTVENYLKALFNLKDAHGMVSISDLSATLEVSMPSVNSMVKNLQKKEFIHYEKYKPISLTEKGRKAAALVIRKHRLTEMYLVEKMGFGWEEVHEIAEQIEHIDSPAFFERMDRILGHPGIDPHGSPIPDERGDIAPQSHQPLNAFAKGDRLTLVALSHSSSEFLDFLNSRELKLGTVLEVISVEPYDGTMAVSYDRHPSEALSAKVAERLMVEYASAKVKSE